MNSALEGTIYPPPSTQINVCPTLEDWQPSEVIQLIWKISVRWAFKQRKSCFMVCFCQCCILNPGLHPLTVSIRCMLAGSMSIEQSRSFSRETSAKKMGPPHWSMNTTVERFLDWCGRAELNHSWSPRWCKKTGWAREQKVFLHGLYISSCFQVPVLTSPRWTVTWSIRWNKSFAPQVGFNQAAYQNRNPRTISIGKRYF